MMDQDPVQADRRLKKSKSFYQRSNSQTFKMFDEAQIKEFKEIFGMMDQNADGLVDVADLVALHGIMGKPADEAALGAMIAAAPSTSRCSSSFSVRRCPEPTPRRPSWPAGTCS